MTNAGGAAMHAGVDYQQRVSALLLICLYARFDLSQLFGHSVPLMPETVSYETSASIDDLNIACRDNISVLIQAKRGLSLSSRAESEFYSVVDQFVRDYISHPDDDRIYILISSSSASRRIIHDLKKILESIRLNDASFRNNPLSKQESDVLQTYRDTFNACCKNHKAQNATDDVFVSFSSRVMIQVLDVESDMTFEKIAILLLHSQRFGIPQLIWKYLISQSVYYASQRQSLNHSAISKLLDRYKMQDMPPDETEPLINELLSPCLVDLDKLPTGKEVLLVSSFTDEADLMLVELFRFDDNGRKRNLIEEDHALLAKGNIKTEIIQRFASKDAFLRFCDKNPEAIKDKRLVLMLANRTEGVEDTSAAEKHRQLCGKLLGENKQLSKCLHSGRSCLTSDAYLVEIDSPSFPPAIGLVRADQLRPLDRILGASFQENADQRELPDFDLGAWLAAFQRGQGLVQSIREMQNVTEQQIVVGWNDANPNASSYSYCIKFTMEDGSFKYCYVRGKIERLPKYEAEARSEYFNGRIQEQRRAGDPWCLTSDNWSVGVRSQLEKIKNPTETILEVSSAEPCKYSDILGRTFNRCDNYYAPMCVVRHPESDQVLSFGGVVPLLSDPFALGKILRNWASAGLETGDVVLSVLKNDYEFDDFMREVFQDHLTPVIDPLLNEDGSASGGIVIRSFQDIAKDHKSAQQSAPGHSGPAGDPAEPEP